MLSLAVLRRLCHAIGEVNKRDDIKNLFIFSMDISGFYPALDIGVCARTAAEMWYASGMKFNLNVKELSYCQQGQTGGARPW